MIQAPSWLPPGAVRGRNERLVKNGRWYTAARYAEYADPDADADADAMFAALQNEQDR